MHTESQVDLSRPLSPPSKYLGESAFSLGSLRNQFYPGCSPSTLMGPLDIPDLHNKLSSSMESQHGSLFRMISGLPPVANDSTMCRDYTCCGLNLSDLHALVEHFEEQHVIVMDSPTLQPMQYVDGNFSLAVAPGPNSIPATQSHQYELNANQGADDSATDPPIDTMDEMDLDVDIDDSRSSSGSGSGSHSGASTPSPPLTPVLPFDTTAIRRPSSTFASIPLISGGSGSTSTSPRLETAFNRYAEYTEFSAMLPGTITSHESGVSPGRSGLHARQVSKSKPCLPPALLSSNTTTPQTSRAPSPSPALGSTTTSNAPTPLRASASASTLSRPASSLLLAKPFRCPKPGCNKSYKQANGLKYHLQHGSCNFAPRDESIDCLSEKEAEARLKPYQCQVPPCTRRYKNMNGLRYHYQHSGAHGAIGLAMLASGQHDHVHSANPAQQNGTEPAHSHPLAAHSQYQVKRSRPSSTASSASNSPVPSRTATPISSPTVAQSPAYAFFHHHQQPQQQRHSPILSVEDVTMA